MNAHVSNWLSVHFSPQVSELPLIREKRLIAAILIRTYLDLRGARKGKYGQATPSQEEVRSTLAWVNNWSVTDYDIPFTFPWCCSSLDLCAPAARKWLVDHYINAKQFTKKMRHEYITYKIFRVSRNK